MVCLSAAASRWSCRGARVEARRDAVTLSVSTPTRAGASCSANRGVALAALRRRPNRAEQLVARGDRVAHQVELDAVEVDDVQTSVREPQARDDRCRPGARTRRARRAGGGELGELGGDAGELLCGEVAHRLEVGKREFKGEIGLAERVDWRVREPEVGDRGAGGDGGDAVELGLRLWQVAVHAEVAARVRRGGLLCQKLTMPFAVTFAMPEAISALRSARSSCVRRAVRNVVAVRTAEAPASRAMRPKVLRAAPEPVGAPLLMDARAEPSCSPCRMRSGALERAHTLDRDVWTTLSQPPSCHNQLITHPHHPLCGSLLVHRRVPLTTSNAVADHHRPNGSRPTPRRRARLRTPVCRATAPRPSTTTAWSRNHQARAPGGVFCAFGGGPQAAQAVQASRGAARGARMARPYTLAASIRRPLGIWALSMTPAWRVHLEGHQKPASIHTSSTERGLDRPLLASSNVGHSLPRLASGWSMCSSSWKTCSQGPAPARPIAARPPSPHARAATPEGRPTPIMRVEP